MKIDLKIGGEIIPLYFGMVALEEMQKLVGSYMGTNKYAADVVWSGYLNKCAIDAVYPSLTYQDVMLKLEEHFFDADNGESNLNEVIQAFDNSKAGSKLFEGVDMALEAVDAVADAVEDVKKKTVKKPLKNSKK